MPRLASDIELVLIDNGKCPHCGSDDVDVDWIGSRAKCDACNVCQKSWTTYTSGRVELEE